MSLAMHSPLRAAHSLLHQTDVDDPKGCSLFGFPHSMYGGLRSSRADRTAKHGSTELSLSLEWSGAPNPAGINSARRSPWTYAEAVYRMFPLS